MQSTTSEHRRLILLYSIQSHLPLFIPPISPQLPLVSTTVKLLLTPGAFDLLLSDGILHLNLDHFSSWVTPNRQENWSRADLALYIGRTKDTHYSVARSLRGMGSGVREDVVMKIRGKGKMWWSFEGRERWSDEDTKEWKYVSVMKIREKWKM